ncbi:MAG: hypothetical protein RLZZ171_2652, partial [Cyanobacteriota bacterium]
ADLTHLYCFSKPFSFMLGMPSEHIYLKLKHYEEKNKRSPHSIVNSKSVGGGVVRAADIIERVMSTGKSVMNEQIIR